MFDNQDEESGSKKKYKNKFKKPQVSKIDKIKNYYAKMNENPEKVEEYVKRKTIEILSMSDKARYEIETKIFKNIKRDLHEELVLKTLDDFEKRGYIDDERFVENYIRIKYNSGFGKKRIEQELKQKKVDMFIFEEFIDNYDFTASLEEYVERKYSDTKEETMKDLNKIYQKLVMRGFDYSSVKNAFEDVTILKEKESNKKTKSLDSKKFLEKMTRKGCGVNKIRQEARTKGIEITQEELDEYDFYEIAQDYKNKKYGEEREKDMKLKQKKINHMLGRGFSYDEIKECI